MVVILAELFLNLPLLSAVFLLIAGVLVGYAIAFPLRGSTDSVAGELRAMREQNEDLETALQQQRDAYARLERRDRDRQRDWAELQASARRMETTLQQQSTDDGAAVNAMREQIEQTQEQLIAHREKCASLETRCKSQATKLGGLRTLAEDYRDLQAKYNMLQEELVHKGELLSRSEEQAELAVATLAEKDGTLQQSAETRATDAAEKLQLSQKVRNLEAALSNQQLRFKELEAEKLTALEKLEVERGQRKASEEQLEATERQLSQMATDACELEGRDQEIVTLQAQLHDVREALQLRTSTEHDSIQKASQLEAAVESLSGELDSHRRAFDTVRRQRDDYQASRDELALRLKSAEEQVEALQQTASESTALKTETTSIHEQLQRNQVEMHALTNRLRQMTVERDSLTAQLAASRDEADELKNHSRSDATHRERLRSQREEILADLRKEQTRSSELSDALQAQTLRISSLSNQLQQLEPLRDEVSSLRRQLVDQQTLASEQDQQDREVDELQRQVTSLSDMLKHSEQAMASAEERAEQADASRRDQQQLVTQYRNERDRALSELRALKVAQSQAANQPPSAASGLEHHPSRGNIYATAPERPDDLKLISGIASVLESRLNALGIYTYQQIMQWEPAHVAEFSKLLSFPDRLERDDWVGQATALFNKSKSQAA